jgi:hypothetical protein
MKYANSQPNLDQGPLRVFRGCDAPIVWNATGAGDTLLLSTSKLVMRIRESADISDEPVLELTSDDSPGGIVLADTDPNITISTDDICLLPVKIYYYDIMLTDSSGKQRPWVINTIEIANVNI